MRNKRRASSVSTGPADHSRRKRRKQRYIINPSDDEENLTEESEDLSANEYYIKCILDETESQYLIDWGAPWPPDWEPKENVNDAAKRAWEEKKKNKEKACLLEKESNSIQILPTPSHISISSEQSAERPESGAALQNLPSSPLFVPFARETDSAQFPQTDEACQRSLDQATPNGRNNNTGTGDSFQEGARQSCTAFEYSPRVPIPLEYRLPGESEELTIPLTPQPDSTSGLNLDGAGSDIQRRLGRPGQALLRVYQSEIPETPPIVPTQFGSQTSSNRSGLQPFGSQPSTQSQSLLSSTLASRICFSEALPLADKVLLDSGNTVPESVSVRTSQTLTHSSSIATRSMEESNGRKEVLSLAETMEKYSHLEGSTPREKIRNAYAKLRDKGPAEALQTDPSATPSSVGDIEPSAPVPVPETVAPLSVRVDKETTHHEDVGPEPAPEPPVESTEPPEPVQTIQPSALTVNHVENLTPGSVRLGPAEFAVPLPMDSRVRDDYQRVLAAETHEICGLLDGTDTPVMPVKEEGIISKIQHVLGRLSNVATHPDLNVTQHIEAPEPDLGKEAAWAEYSSAKFLLLGYLVDAASSHNLHVVITVREEKAQKVVEGYLMGKGLTYTRPREEMGSGNNVEVSMAKGSLSFGIQSTRNDGVMETYKPPSAILALDSSLNTKSPSVQHMRTTYARNGSLLPVIRLIIANSSEHIELCYPGSSTFQHVLLLLRQSHSLREMVGDLQDDALGVHEDADEILSCLLSDNFNTHWSLPPIEPLRNASPSDLVPDETQNESTIHAPSASTPATQKRVLTMDDEHEQTSKRPRMEISQDTGQLTELSKGPSQTLDNDLYALEKNLVQMRNSHASALEKLQKALAATQSRLQEREKILDSLQHRYETRTKDLHKIRQERDRLVESKTSSDQVLERRKDDITKLKDERTQLKRDLEQARESLKSGGGDMAELELAREEIRRLTKENASLERKAEYERKQAEYTREQYQTASNVAAQSGNEIRQLREENESLKRKVEGDATRLRELNIKNDETRHLARVAELETILVSREDLLRRKEDELREIRKNRPSTRSTSTQPRSPKWTASRPTSPGFNNGSNFPGRGSALRFSSEMTF